MWVTQQAGHRGRGEERDMPVDGNSQSQGDVPGPSGVPGAGLHSGPDGICALWKQRWTKSLEIIAVSSIHL